MVKNTVNDKSKQISIRIPHDVIDSMEALKRPDESNAGFIVTAMRGEVARRQATATGPESLQLELNRALETLAKIEEIGERAGTDIRAIVDIAHAELEARQRKKSKDNPDQ
ncbi:hypothetical protein KP965_004164 [Salmonella enterica subsp. enterica serovar Carrau]|uniref:YlcI/YnfO family protein n=1 Tax=Salmonella enterica TaxID=28901 RepID=UPI000BE48CC6|nr:YlcI/YnfO family protein [Salmonella enterica]ECF6858460.1 hypothetical protein [Salmonella enterica subsp. arizonae]ECI4632960.1 hypothetical protein [Salmonella enterica subsp. enterica serovar Hartford]EDW1774465.1 hypothetical protein [Salmonella enterica subsp. diarizonae]ATI87275.1 hypothetical protein CGA24_21235 [Salmonella enterica subsp. enterica]EAM3112442.1 hypothetical protein [Salmonella enterica]